MTFRHRRGLMLTPVSMQIFYKITLLLTRVTEKQNSSFKNWVNIAVSLTIGIIQKPKLDFYWTNNAFFETQIFKRLISRTRCQQLRTMIHISGPLEFNENDLLNKLRYMMNELSNLYTLSAEIFAIINCCGTYFCHFDLKSENLISKIQLQ